MPQSDYAQAIHRGSKNTLNSTSDSIDFEYLGMDEATKKAIKDMGDIRVPRSGRSIVKLEGREVKRLYYELDNHEKYNLSILHMKDYGLTDTLEPAVMDKLITKIGKATTIQVLYIQNFPDGMLDQQLEHLTSVLKQGHIWALNIGEASKVTRRGWERFADALSETNVTHMYASENTLLTKKLKIKMLDKIRENRKKDKRHYSKSNRAVIDKITHMWFNPRRSNKYQLQFQTNILESKSNHRNNQGKGGEEHDGVNNDGGNPYHNNDGNNNNTNNSYCGEEVCLVTGKKPSTQSTTGSTPQKKSVEASRGANSSGDQRVIITKKTKSKSSSPPTKSITSSLKTKRKAQSTKMRAKKVRADSKTLKKGVADKVNTKHDAHTRKPRYQLQVPTSNLATEKELSKMSFRQQMACITRQSEQEITKKKGSGICKTFLFVHWKEEDTWRLGFVESYNETTGKHRIKFDLKVLGYGPVFLDIDLSTVQTKTKG